MSDRQRETSSWSIDDSEELYRVDAWGEPYFSINAAGHIMVSPKGNRGGSIDLYELVEALQRRNLSLPLLIRFGEILEDRIERLNACFARAIARYGYNGVYKGVFPVKCNQQRHLIENLVACGRPFQFGLEAGSKPELLISLALLDTPGALIICNGYKDRAFMETAILAQQLGKTPLLVLEQPEEVSLVIEVSRELGIPPLLGVRAKLSSRGMGRWASSSGEGAKFGLNLPEIVEAVEQLREAELLDHLQLLHFHVGSQIADINVVKDALQEASQLYVQLVQMGAGLQYMDVGGGLGVDYDGSKTRSAASKNYNMQTYANDVVATMRDACLTADVPMPTLVSESGRALASHQCVVVFDVLGCSGVPRAFADTVAEDDSQPLQVLAEIRESITEKNYQECYHDAEKYKADAISAFRLGYMSLPERARAERLYWACLRKIQAVLRRVDDIPEDLAGLEQRLASTYYINFSVFQSAPDAWAIDQLFPILPIHRLHEEPIERAILADLTCDSDGKIQKFIGRSEVKSLLEVHPLRQGEPYVLGMFLGGAYQETMGNLHNLFGDTHAVHIELTPKGYAIKHVVKGDTMEEVLGYVQYSAEALVESVRLQTEDALSEGRLSLEGSQRLLENFASSLQRYTYLQAEPDKFSSR